MQGMEVIVQRCLYRVGDLCEIGRIESHEFGMDLDELIRRRDHIDFGGEQTAQIQVGADGTQHAVAGQWLQVVGIGDHDDTHDSWNLNAGEGRMTERHGEGAGHVGCLFREIFEVRLCNGAIAASQGHGRTQFGIVESLFVAAGVCRKQIRDLAGIYSGD